MVLLTLEVSFPLDGAIILATGLGKLYSDPVAGLEVGRSQEADSRDAIVVQFNCLADGEGGGVHGRYTQSRFLRTRTFIVRQAW